MFTGNHITFCITRLQTPVSHVQFSSVSRYYLGAKGADGVVAVAAKDQGDRSTAKFISHIKHQINHIKDTYHNIILMYSVCVVHYIMHSLSLREMRLCRRR